MMPNQPQRRYTFLKRSALVPSPSMIILPYTEACIQTAPKVTLETQRCHTCSLAKLAPVNHEMGEFRAARRMTRGVEPKERMAVRSARARKYWFEGKDPSGSGKLRAQGQLLTLHGAEPFTSATTESDAQDIVL